MTRIYTRTGDKGETSLFSGKRVKKTNSRIRALGELDELNSCIGVASSFSELDEISEVLGSIQSDILTLCAEIGTEDSKQAKMLKKRIDETSVRNLESTIDKYSSSLPELKNFIIPGGCPTASFLHLARTVCRRAEREVVALSGEADVSPHILAYLNRLSDLLFVVARYVNFKSGGKERLWIQ